MSKMREFKAYLIARLNELKQKRSRDTKTESEFDLAYTELSHIFERILPELEEERKNELRDFEHKWRNSFRRG